jgi:uncharacterized protein YjbI with pentapeptide repeats
MAEGQPLRDEDAAKMRYAVADDDPPSAGRQRALAKQLNVQADSATGRFPFKGITLSRSDVRWLLANTTETLDLRGANLSGTDLHRIDFRQAVMGLDMDEYERCTIESVLRTRAGPHDDLFALASVNLNQCDLTEANLAGVILTHAQLREAIMMATDLAGAELRDADMSKSQLQYANLAGAALGGTLMREINASDADMRGCVLSRSVLTDADLHGCDLRGSTLREATLCGAVLSGVRFDGATDLKDVSLVGSGIDGAPLTSVGYLLADDASSEAEAPLVVTSVALDSLAVHDASSTAAASLVDVDWGGVNLAVIDWEKVITIGDEEPLLSASGDKKDLRRAKEALAEVERQLAIQQPIEALERLKREYTTGEPPEFRSDLDDDDLEEAGRLLKVATEGEPLVESALRLNKRITDRSKLLPSELLDAQRDAARAYRQLAIVLRSQGITGPSARFGYKALKLQRIVPRRERELPRVASPAVARGALAGKLSWVRSLPGRGADVIKSEMRIFPSFAVDLVCGYGYRPGRAIVTYFSIVALFAIGYGITGMRLFPDALVFSVASFHGRGFSNMLDYLGVGAQRHVIYIAAAEAFVGLLTEVVLVATFTRRLFDR